MNNKGRTNDALSASDKHLAAKVISLVNQKGGVAKTTTAAALADYFARHGKKTLLVDFDPQGSLTTSFGLSDEADTPAAFKFLGLEKGTEALPAEVKPELYGGNLHIITSDIGLERANVLLTSRVGRERFLRRAINEITQKERYDYVIIDSNPSFSILTMNVIYASDYVIVPFKPEFNSFKGIMQLFDNVKEMQDFQPNLAILGFVITMARKNVKSTDEAIRAIKEFAAGQGCRVFMPVIRLAAACADAPSHGKSLNAYAPDSNVAKDYEELGEAVLEALEDK